MLANSILWNQVVNKIKFMCQIIAMSWTLTIKCMLLHQITEKINVSSTTDVQLKKQLDDII